MHYRMLVTFDRNEAQDSAEARDHVSEELIEDTTFMEGGRFSMGYCDWFVAGGRWSGELSRATWAQAVQKEIDQLEKQEGLQVWGVYYGDQEKRDRQAVLKVKALYAEALPEAYQGQGLVYTRDTYQDMGYEDDAMLVSEQLYDALLAEYEGQDLADDWFGVAFVDLDWEPVSRDFVDKKWLVVVDAHV